MKLLIVEDDRGLAGGITFSMERDGHTVFAAGTVADARRVFEKERPDAILLDLNLPDGDGMEFCREIRAVSRTPILMLTARDMETDEVQGLLSGADDYLTKPFSLAVLKAHLDAVVRRSLDRMDEMRSGMGGNLSEDEWMRIADARIPISKYTQNEQKEYKNTDREGSGIQNTENSSRNISDSDVLTVGEIRLQSGSMKVFRGEKEIECSATEFRLLYYLMKNCGQVLLKEQILAHVWDHAGSFVDENTLQVTIRRLRRKLEDDPSKPEYIRTVHGMGYVFLCAKAK